jgi:FkbM family methyltransferase
MELTPPSRIDRHSPVIVSAASAIYARSLASTGIRRRCWNALRQFLIRRLGDPPCVMPVHGRAMTMPLSHALPFYLAAYAEYDRLPARLAAYVHRKKSRLTCIDVGANIGDTVAAFSGDGNDRFLAIEPNPSFRDYLVKNWSGNASVVVESVLCSAATEEGRFEVDEHCGTARIRAASGGIGVEMQAMSLDDVIARHAAFAEANVLKIDTDGHDFQVIAGAQGLIAAATPAVLFECDAFSNPRYVEDCAEALRLFAARGYHAFLLYDNLGYLLGKYSLADLAAFKRLLFYQLTSAFDFFDILVMPSPDLDEFHALEVEHFVGTVRDAALVSAARTASA